MSFSFNFCKELFIIRFSFCFRFQVIDNKKWTKVAETLRIPRAVSCLLQVDGPSLIFTNILSSVSSESIMHLLVFRLKTA